MWSLLRKLRPNRKRFRVGKALCNALALQRRGEARPDGLSSFSFSVRLTVNWRARDLHPWDRDMPEERRAPRFVEQTLDDTEAAVERIFKAFSEVNTLEVNVFEKDPASDRVIMSGVIRRSDLGLCSSSSIGMRLRMLGIHYRLAEQYFAPIAIGKTEPKPVDHTIHDFDSGRLSRNAAQPSAELASKSRQPWRDSERHPG
jgi:hypothetical protein